MNQQALQAYKHYQYHTATPAELTLMLYEGALKFLRQAKHMLETEQYPAAHDFLIKAQKIYYELMVTLKDGYDISEPLRLLYQYMIDNITAANIQKDAKMIEQLLPMAEEFVDMWREAMKKAKNPGSGAV